MLRIALPNKGRLADETRELFNQAGLDIRVRNDRALTALLGEDFEAIFVRAQDIPEFVADDAADAGVTGLDLVYESGRTLDSRLDLGFGRCRLVLAAREESTVRCLSDISGNPRIATVFPAFTRRFFENLGTPVTIVPISGAVEIAPHLGIADLIVDLSSTGSTLLMNGLREVTTLLESTAHLISSPSLSTAPNGAKLEAMQQLVTAVDSVLRARGKRYLMANVPRTSLERVKEILPGLNGPTVTDILNGGLHVAVHAVVDAATLYRTICQLKTAGGEGILVTRIERLMP